jgi:DNA-binding beta-propeller fold protein YncE
MEHCAPADRHLLVCGRWDPWLSVVSLDEALDPTHWGTDRAVINRLRVTPDVAGPGGVLGPACGLPVSVAVSRQLGRLFVVNHAGSASADATARMPHGHAGSVAVLDLAAALDRGNTGTLNAVSRIIATGTHGPVGGALTPDGAHLLVAAGEGSGTEDGGCAITVVRAADGTVLHNYPLAAEGVPSAHPSPHRDFGRYPDPAGIAATAAHGGLVFTGNGGTDDVSVLRLSAVLAGHPGGEIARIPVRHGPFGIAVSPDDRLLAVANRESARTGIEGNSISLIDIARAASDPARAVAAEVLVGTDRIDEPTRPMSCAFAPDGALFAVSYRTGAISRIDTTEAREVRRIALATPDGSPACPRGVCVVGPYVAVSGGAKSHSGSSWLWILDAASLETVGLVGGVGNEAYLVAPL